MFTKTITITDTDACTAIYAINHLLASPLDDVTLKLELRAAKEALCDGLQRR